MAWPDPPAAGAITPFPRTLIAALLIGLTALSLLYGVLSESFVEGDDITHYLYARYAPAHPHYFLDVWGRPLVTGLYALPAQYNPEMARALTSLVAALGAWLAWRTSRSLALSLAPLGLVLTFTTPRFFQLSFSLLTEPLFAVLLTGAILAYMRGHRLVSAAIVSLSPLARPEGFFVGVLWGLLFLFAPQDGAGRGEFRKVLRHRLLPIVILPLGTLAWNAVGFATDGDPLWLVHHWPSNWVPEPVYGSGSWTHFLSLMPGFVTYYFFAFFLLGFFDLLRRGQWLVPLVCAYMVALHTVLWGFGLFGSAGYSRYLVSVAPAFAICTTAGFSRVFDWIRHRWPRPGWAIGVVSALAVALLVTVWPHVTPCRKAVDFALIDPAAKWVQEQLRARPGTRVAAAHTYLYFAADIDSWYQGLPFTEQELRKAPVGTLAFWETAFAEGFSRITPEDLCEWGYERIDKKGICDWDACLGRVGLRETGTSGSTPFDWEMYEKRR